MWRLYVILAEVLEVFATKRRIEDVLLIFWGVGEGKQVESGRSTKDDATDKRGLRAHEYRTRNVANMDKT